MYSLQVVIDKKAYLAPYSFHVKDDETVITFYPDRMDKELLCRLLQLAISKVVKHWQLDKKRTRWYVQHLGDMFTVNLRYPRYEGLTITLSPSGLDGAQVSAW